MRRFPVFVLAFMAFNNLVRGFIHAAAPDGGAHSIAGLDLSSNAQTILSLFAALGVAQLSMALFQIFVLAWRRDLVAIALGLQTIETVLAVGNLMFWRTMPKLVPGEIFNAALIPLLAAAFLVALRNERLTARRA